MFQEKSLTRIGIASSERRNRNNLSRVGETASQRTHNPQLIVQLDYPLPNSQDYFKKFEPLTVVVPYSKINEVRQKCGCKMRSIKIFLFTIAAAALTTLVHDVIDVGLLGLLFIIYFLIFAGVIVYWFTLFIGFLLDKFVPKDIQDKIGHALIVWANRQEETSYTTPKKRKSSRQSQSRYKAQYRQSTTWWDVCPPTFENAAISYAEKYKDNNPNAKVRVVEVIDGKVIGTIYSC